jgi:hypothetical protein
LDERVIVLARFFRSGVAPRAACMMGFPSWKKSSCSEKAPLTCPRAQDAPSWVATWLSTLAARGAAFVVGSCSDGTAGVSGKKDEITWLSGV